MKNATIQAMIAEILTGQEAQRRGVSVAALFAKEVAGISLEPGEVDAAYVSARRQFGLTPEFEARQQLRENLLRRKRSETYQKLVEGLRAAADIRIFLASPTVDIPVNARTDAIAGPATALVTIIEFADFECVYCRQSQEALKRLLRDYPHDVRLVFRHFPLQTHKTALRAATASVCAQQQGRFWEYHNRLFSTQPPFSDELLGEIGVSIGMDRQGFFECLQSRDPLETVNEHLRAGERAGVVSTPTFVVNGQVLRGALPYEQWKSILDQRLRQPRESVRAEGGANK